MRIDCSQVAEWGQGEGTTNSKQMHSSMIFLPWAMTSDNAPFDLKIGEHLVLGLLSSFQGGGCDYVA